MAGAVAYAVVDGLGEEFGVHAFGSILARGIVGEGIAILLLFISDDATQKRDSLPV